MKILKNTLWLMLSFLGSKLLITLWQLYLARYFSTDPAQYGYYRLLITQYGVWLLLAEGSLVYAVQQFIAQERGNAKVQDYWAFIVVARTFSGMLSGILFALVLGPQYPALIVPICILSVSMVAVSIGTAPLGVWAGLSDFRPEAKASIISLVVFLSAAILAVTLTRNINILIACTLFSSCLQGMYLWKKSVGEWGLPSNLIKSVKEYWKKFVVFCFPLTFSSFIFRFFFMGDMIIVTKKLGAQFAGVYSISLMLFFMTADLLWSQFGKAYTPSLISSWSDPRKGNEIYVQIKTVICLYGFLGILCLFGASFFGATVMVALFGKGSFWINSIGPLIWLLVGFLPTVIYGLVFRILLLERGAGMYTIVSFVVVVLKLSVVNFFADSIGLTGIAMVNSFFILIFYTVITFLLTNESRRVFWNKGVIFRIIGPVLASVSIIVAKDNLGLSLFWTSLLMVGVLLSYFYMNRDVMAPLFYKIKKGFTLKRVEQCEEAESVSAN